MVSVEKNNTSDYVISLSPNSSLEGAARFLFLASITLVCGGIAVIFYFFGAFMILPFAGIELTILFIEIYFAYSNNQDNSKIGWLNKIIQNNISKYLKNYNKNEIEKLLKVLLNFDKMMKTSSINKKHLIINLLFKIHINHGK